MEHSERRRAIKPVSNADALTPPHMSESFQYQQNERFLIHHIFPHFDSFLHNS